MTTTHDQFPTDTTALRKPRGDARLQRLDLGPTLTVHEGSKVVVNIENEP